MQKRSGQKRLFHMLLLSLAVLLIGGGLALCLQWHQGPTPSQASSDSVVGPPSLPASLVDAIFQRLGSPMVGSGQAVEAASRAANIDDAFALAVWWTETNDGAAGVGRADRNPGSVRGSAGYPSAYDGYTIYPSYTAAVNYWFPMLKRGYIDRGLTTVYTIAHPYVGTSTSYLWAGKVTTLMNRYRSEAPAPTPTPKPTVAPSLQRVQQTLAQQAHQPATNSAAPVVVSTPTLQQQPRDQTAPAGLGENVKMLLVLFDLFIALALGLWAWSVNRRYSSRPEPLLQTQPVGNLWEDLRASQQRPSAFFGQHSLSGLLGNTETLNLGVKAPNTELLAVNASNADMLGATNPLQPAYRAVSANFSSASRFTNQAQVQTPRQPQSTPAFNGQLPFEVSPPVLRAQHSFNSSAFTEQLSFGAPDPIGVEQLSFDAPAPAFAVQPDQFSPANLCAPNIPQHARLQPTPEMPVRQPQLVGVGASGGRSNGLLSRYRETQAREG